MKETGKWYNCPGCILPASLGLLRHFFSTSEFQLCTLQGMFQMFMSLKRQMFLKGHRIYMCTAATLCQEGSVMGVEVMFKFGIHMRSQQ